MKYKVKSGYKYSDKDAQLIGHFFEDKFPQGRMTPDKIIDLAKSKKSIIHKYFEWDDTSAAHMYRMEQARHMIRAIYVEIQGQTVRAYENVHIKDVGQVYQDIGTILDIPDLSKQIVESALKELLFWKQKYETYKILAPIVGSINKNERRIKSWLKRKQPKRSQKTKKKK